MEELTDLISVSLSGRISGVETFNQFTENKKSLVYKLFSNISAGKINTDADARHVLYGPKYSGKSYDVLKRRFKEKLYTNVLFLQPRVKDTKAYAYNAYFVHKHYIVARLLLYIAARRAGIRIMEKVYKKAAQYQVTEIAMLAALYLKKDAAFNGNKTLYKKYLTAFTRFSDTLHAEAKAEEKYEELSIEFTIFHNARPDLIPQAKKSLAYINKLKNTFGTYTLHQTSFYTQILYYNLLHDYKATLAACNSFESYLQSNPLFYSSVRHASVLSMKLGCYLHLGQYKEGLALADEAIKKYESAEGNINVLQETHFLLALRSGDYGLAANIYNRVAERKLKNLDDRQKEIWRIYSGYLWLCLTMHNLIEVRKQTFSKTEKFNHTKLLNEIPIYTKDKQGLNLSLYFLQLAMLIQQADFERAIEKTEQLKTYIHKYISTKSGARDHVMLKLALLLPKYNFDQKILEKKSALLLEKLKTLVSREQTYERTHIEVLLYNKFWEIILKLLKAKKNINQ